MSRKTSGPYSYDDDEDYVPTKKIKYSASEGTSISNKQHTLDSDEEDGADNGRKYDVLGDEDIDGQEEGTIDFEGETKITPFNMKEEMEDGHFDKDGFYHFKKDNEDLKDAWLDNIDWVKVKHTDKNSQTQKIDEDDEENDASNLIPIYEEIFSFLKEGETVSRALKRIGGKTKRISSAERWKLKKAGKLNPSVGSEMDSFLKLTELANKIIESGNMDVYQETYEMIKLKIERSKATKDTNPSFDMFADGNIEDSKASVDNSTEKDTFDEIQWLYKLKNEDDSEIYGPYNSQQMLDYQLQGRFKEGAYVRKTTDADGNWYKSARIDFDLYT